MRWIWVVMVLFTLVVVVHNFIVSSDDALPWVDLIFGCGFILVATAFLWVSRRWFNFIAGSDACKWRDER
jgi:hypothetical protein